MQAELIYNPRAGQVVVRHELENVITFLRRSGWNVVWQETTRPKEATELARNALQRGAKVVIAAGGDGTISEVANGLLGSDAALGVLPVGTTNAWTLQMGIPALNPFMLGKNVVKLVADVEDNLTRVLPANFYRKVLLNAARVLVEGHTVKVDLGEISGRYFLMWAGIGLDAAIVENMSLKEKHAWGTWAYALQTIRTIGHYSGTAMRLILDGNVVESTSPLVIVSNIQLYSGVLPVGAKACINDARLDVCVFKGEGFFTFIQHALKVLSRKHLKDSQIDYYQCREIVIESASGLPVHLDGEYLTRTPVTIRTVPLALKVLVPQKISGSLLNE